MIKNAMQILKNLVAITLFLFAGIKSAWPEAVELEKIVVTPSRIEEASEATGSSITVVSGKSIEEEGIFLVRDALKGINSLDIAGTGGPGGRTSIFLRGANSGQVRVMIDGVMIHDPASTDASYDFAHLTTDNIEKIEVLRGPQSSLYGSDAMGGVINIITKKGQGKPKISLLLEEGSFYTSRETLNVDGEKDKLHFSFSSSRLDMQGFSKAKEKNNNPEKDAYQNTDVSLRLDYDLAESLTLGFINRYSHSRTEYDDYDYINDIPTDDSDRVGWNDEGLSSLLLEQKIPDLYKHKLQLSFTRNYRRGKDDTDEYERDWYDGRTYQLDWQSELDLFNFNKVLMGVNYLREEADTYYYHNLWGESDFPKSTSNIKGFFIENKLNIYDNLYFNTVYRIDDHSEFKDHDTYKFELSYLLDKIDMRLRGLFGTGFKSPSLYQLSAPPMYGSPVGNLNLKPEESEGYEAGIEQGFFERKILADITYFHTHFKNLIDFGGTGYVNLSRAETSGIESNLRFKKGKLTARLGYTLLDTENKENGDDLLKRAKNKINMEFDWDSLKWDLNFRLGYVGHRTDYKNTLLKGYMLANLSLNYKINRNFNIFGRIENLFNEKYEESKGYQTAPFSVYSGVKVKF